MNQDFHALYDLCMEKIKARGSVCMRGWYDTQVSNDRAGRARMN